MPKTSVNALLKDIELLSTIEMVRPFAVCFLIAIGKERGETKWGKGQRQVTEPPLPLPHWRPATGPCDMGKRITAF